MKTIFSFVGFVVIMILLASTGVIKGDACLSNVGCIGADGGGIRFHSPETTTQTTPP
jgi:hypothetical protein